MKSGDILGGIASTTNTVTGLVQGLSSNITKKDGSKATLKDIKDGDFKVNNNFYANAGVNLGFNKSSSKSNSHNESAVVTTIKGKDENSSITYNNVKNVEYVGTQAQNTKFIYNNVENINKRAVELKNSYSSSSTSSGISTGVTIGYGDGTQTSVDAVKVSASQSKMNSNGTTYQNGRFVNVDEVHNNTKNMTLSGFNQEGGTVTGNIENLTIESKQNTSITKGRTIGGSLSIAPNGMPSGSANYSQTNGERRVVDNASTFIIGDGSNLKVGKVENTAAAIGTSGNGKLSIDEYVGHDLENVDKLKTVGGSVGVSASGITSLGVNYSDRKQEGITKNTVIGNVEIGKSSGDEINRDLDTMTEITEDRDFKTNINVESQTINYIKNPEKFKEDLQKAKNEVEDLENAVKNTSNPLGKDKRNVFSNLRAQRWSTSFYNVIGSRVEELGRQFKAGTINEEEVKEALRDVVKGYGKDIGIDFDVVYLDESTMPKDSKGSTGSSYIVDKENRKVLIPIDVNKIEDIKKVLGTLTEEVAHGKDALEGRQDKKVAEDKSNDEEGLESLGRPANEYVKKKFGEDNNSKIKLTTDGIDLTNADVGEKVGDDIFDDSAHKEALNFTLRDGSKKLTNSSLKVIEEKGIEYALEKGLVKYESTIHKKFSEEKAIKKEIDEKQKIAIQKSKEDPLYNYYLAVDGVSRKVTIEKELKPNSFGKNLKDSTSKALKEGYDSVINSVPNYDKWQEKSKEYGDMESSLAGSVLLQTVGNLITVPGRMATEMNLFGPGEIQYGSVKDIKRRQQELNDVIRGKADLLTTIVAYSAVESIKDSKIFQKFKNKITPSEIPDIKIEDGGSNVVNIQNKDLAKEYQNLINSKKQQDFERIKKGVKEKASVKAKELNKLKKDLVIDNVNDTTKLVRITEGIGDSSGVTKAVVKEIKVVDNSADITKTSKNLEKATDVSEDITKAVAKEVKVIDKSNDTGKIAKNTKGMKPIKKEQTLEDIFTKEQEILKTSSPNIGVKDINKNGIKIKYDKEKYIKQIEDIKLGDLNGKKTENLVDEILNDFTKKNPDFEIIDAKYGSDNGIDHMLKNKKTGELWILDSKQMSGKSITYEGGAVKLSKDGAGGNIQLSSEWVNSVAGKKTLNETAKKELEKAIKTQNYKTGIAALDKKTGDLIVAPIEIIPKKNKK